MVEIKAVIFDLDDTLYNQESLRESAIRQSVQAVVDKGLKCSLEEGIKKMKELIGTDPRLNKFETLVNYFNGADEELWKLGKEVYINADFEELKLYPEVNEVLESLKKNLRLFLVTEGTENQQNKKIDALGIRDYFDNIFVTEGSKEKAFNEILNDNLKLSEVLVVGDRIDKEIAEGKKLGMKTIRVLRGIYKNIEPTGYFEKPDFEIKNLRGILEIINMINNIKLEKSEFNNGEKVDHSLKINNKKQLKIVAIGGGTGLPMILEGLRKYTNDLTAIVTVTDSGRSSGILRKELNVLPPGDIRNCLIALSNSDKLMCDLFQYRFDNGSLEGHNFGNLFIAALTKLTGSFERGVAEVSKILKLTGKVLPSTFDNIHICAKLEDGSIIEEEDNIIDRHNKLVHLRSPIKEVFLKPQARANVEAVKEIEQADLIVLCPGSLFTSVITNLLVKGIVDAVDNSKAKKVYICNIMTQQSQTSKYKASEHVKEILKYLNKNLDYVILNNTMPSKELIESYKEEGAELIENDVDEIGKLGVNVIIGELLDESSERKMLWEKKDLLRHSSERVAKVLVGLLG